MAAGFGLAAPFLMVVNALDHVGASVRVLGYNPGLVTVVVLVLTLGIATLVLTDATLGQHFFGLGVALAVHLAIAVATARRARWPRASGAPMRPTFPI